MLFSSVNFENKENVIWQEASAIAGISNNIIDVWQMPVLTDAALLDSLYSLLNAAELKRASAYRLESDRRRFITSRGSLRILSGRHLQQQPEDVLFLIGDDKKPFLMSKENSVQYNVSHSGDCILIAFGNTAVGVDVEKIDISFPYQEILQSAFSRKEIEFVQRSNRSIELFYLLWTRKEALLKATGKGLTDDLALISSLDGKSNINADIIRSGAAWNICSFDAGEKYIASLAYNPSGQTIRFFTMSYAEMEISYAKNG